MKPWDIYTWDFPQVGEHPAVIIGNDERVEQKPFVNVLLCSSKKAARLPKPSEVLLDAADGLDWATLCKCDFVYAVEARQLGRRRGTVTHARRREIASKVIRGLGLAGL